MLTKPDKLKLFTLMGNYPNAMALKEGKLASDILELDFADVKVSNTAFKPLVREAFVRRFDDATRRRLRCRLGTAAAPGRRPVHSGRLTCRRITILPSASTP